MRRSLSASILGFALVAVCAPSMPVTAQETTAADAATTSASAAAAEHPAEARAVQTTGKGASGDEVIAPIVEAVTAPVVKPVEALASPLRSDLSSLIARHAAANNVPPELVRRVIMRESRGNPRAISKGNYGIMQIRLGTARALGYRGDANGLLDADTNMTYAVKYLAGAYRVAGGSHDRAVMNYARGYYYEAKRQGINAYAPNKRAARIETE